MAHRGMNLLIHPGDTWFNPRTHSSSRQNSRLFGMLKDKFSANIQSTTGKWLEGSDLGHSVSDSVWTDDRLKTEFTNIGVYGLTLVMKVPQLARMTRGASGIISFPIQMLPSSSATAAE